MQAEEFTASHLKPPRDILDPTSITRNNLSSGDVNTMEIAQTIFFNAFSSVQGGFKNTATLNKAFASACSARDRRLDVWKIAADRSMASCIDSLTNGRLDRIVSGRRVPGR